MSGIDQFESAFRATLREPFVLAPPAFKRILVISDTEAEHVEAHILEKEVAALIPGLDLEYGTSGSATDQVAHITLAMDAPIAATLEAVEKHAPDLIVTHRGLASPSWRQPFTLGENLEVLTQVATPPVLALPHPAIAAPDFKAAARIMALSDRLAGDHALVNAALSMTPAGAHLILAHIEDAPSFERFLDAISKIPSINTDEARQEIAARLIKEPTDFAASAQAAILDAGKDLHSHVAQNITVDTVINQGAHMRDCLALVHSQSADLLVFNTKDEDQLAMHGLAHSLAIELRELPLLLL